MHLIESGCRNIVAVERYAIARRLIFACLVSIFGFASALWADGDNGHNDSKESLTFPSIFDAKPYFSHIHGTGFQSRTDTVIVVAHDGLWFYENQYWSQRDLPAHDYMGFAPVRDGFYASGHPDLTTDLPNPLGLVKLTIGGEYQHPMSYSGVLDFHNIAAGFNAGSIYVYNENSIPGLPNGLNYSIDDGESWHAVAEYPGTEAPAYLSAHPTNSGTAAIIISGAVFLTSDFGRNYTNIEATAYPTVLFFHPDGEQLLIGKEKIYSFDLLTGEITFYPAPSLTDDVISHIAVSQTIFSHIVVTTAGNAVFTSQNGGDDWIEISAHNETP